MRAAVVCLAGACAVALGCKRPDPGPAFQIVGESARLRTADPVPATSPWFDGTRISLVAARGEVVGLQVLHRGGGPVVLTLRPWDTVRGQPARRRRPPERGSAGVRALLHPF